MDSVRFISLIRLKSSWPRCCPRVGTVIDRRAPAPSMIRGWLIVAAVVAVTMSAGCRLPRRDGPNYAPLVQSRRLTQQGRTAHDRRRPRQAESFFAQAVEACPADPEARYHFADALWRRGARAGIGD